MDKMTIGNQTYPDDVIAILADRELSPLFRSYIKTVFAEENVLFLDEVANRFDPKKLYPKYIALGSKFQLNISSDVRKEAAALAEAKDWKNKKWKDIGVQCANRCEGLLDLNYKLKFWSYEPFLKYHRDRAAKKMKGDPTKAAQLLGISDVKSTKELMVAHAAGDEKVIKQKTAVLVKKPELKEKKVKASGLTKLLRKAKLI